MAEKKTYLPQNRDEALAQRKTGYSAGMILWLLGFIFALIGITAEAASVDIVLLPMSWFLLSIAFFIASLPAWMVYVAYSHLFGIDKKK